MRRRKVLALCGTALAGTAGCLSQSSDGGSTPTDDSNTPTPTETPTETPTGTPTATPSDVALSVSLDALQPAVLQLYTDAFGVSSESGRQYLFLELSTTAGGPPSRSDLAFRFDGTEHALSDASSASDLYRLYEHEQSRYDADRGSGWVLFELPDSGDAADAALVWPGGEWRPDEGLRNRLGAPTPSLSLEWSVPETAPVGSNPALGFTVTNEGDYPARFVAGINRQGWKYAYIPLERVSSLVPAGETASWEVPDEYGIERDAGEKGAIGDGKPDVTYGLRWTGERKQRQVRVVEG